PRPPVAPTSASSDRPSSLVSQTEDYGGREGLEPAILDALAAMGKDTRALTVDDLAPLDQFHGGGKGVTVRFARLAGLGPGMRVLDVGGGLGGPARTLAGEFGCRVTAMDLTESYVPAAAMLTARLGLAAHVEHRIGDALSLPFDDEVFDAVWTQNSGMNITTRRASTPASTACCGRAACSRSRSRWRARSSRRSSP